jgi:hypothetical protein
MRCRMQRMCHFATPARNVSAIDCEEIDTIKHQTMQMNIEIRTQVLETTIGRTACDPKHYLVRIALNLPNRVQYKNVCVSRCQKFIG